MIPIVRRLAKYGRTVGRRSDFTWRYLLNFRATVSYAVQPPTLANEAARVLECLNRDGVAVTSTQALLGAESCYPELVRAVDRHEREMAAEIAAFRESMIAGTQTARKKYILGLLSENRPLDATDIYTRFALQEPIPQIVNAYYGMCVTLCQCNVWHNFVTREAPSQSQLWHRDPEDRYIVKVFVYMVDVDDGSGPFVYAAGSHPKGKLARDPAYTHKDGNTPRSDDAQMAAVVPETRWVKCVGARGTMVFADTRGYHKGGLARERDRLLYVCEFLSPAAAHAGGIATTGRLDSRRTG
jgi:hypothetical protein